MENEGRFIKGFNHGYLIAKHLPDLMARLGESIKATNDYLEGFVSGKKEYELELSQARIIELDQLRDQSGGRDLER